MENRIHNRFGHLILFNKFKQLLERFSAKTNKVQGLRPY